MTSAESAIREWLRGRGVSDEVLDLDYDLVDNRAIDSLHFMEFVLLVEELTGRDVLSEGASLDQLRTLRAIREHYLAPDESAEEEIAF